MIESYFLAIACLGVSTINAEELLTGKLVATGNTKEEVGLSSNGSGFSEYDVEEVQVIDRRNISSILVVIIPNHDILSWNLF